MPKLPPQNIEAEESVLGGLMLDKHAIIRVADVLRAEDFYKPMHGSIYAAFLKLYEKGQPIDILTVTNSLKDAGQLDGIGGATFLTSLTEKVPTSSHIEHYAKLVKEKKILRDLISVSSEITESAFTAPEDLEQLLDQIESRIFSISQGSVSQKFIAIKDQLNAAYERIERLHQGDGALRGVPTGFPQLDNILSGFQKSDLVIVGARPSVGKTSLVLGMLAQAAIKHNIPVGIFSIEMSREQVIDRIIAAEAGVALWKLRTGKLRDETDFELIQHSLDTLSRAPIYIDDTPSPSILQMRAMARRLQAEHGLAMIVVDYLQLIQPRTNSDNVVSQITEISRGLKGLARELNVPVIALSQLSRGVESRDTGIPRLSDLRDSGSIEQDADVVMFIYRKDRNKTGLDPAEENMAELIVAKHRNGPLGTVQVKFDPDTATFRSIDRQHGE
jgi:replicative DNA helicase